MCLYLHLYTISCQHLLAPVQRTVRRDRLKSFKLLCQTFLPPLLMFNLHVPAVFLFSFFGIFFLLIIAGAGVWGLTLIPCYET